MNKRTGTAGLTLIVGMQQCQPTTAHGSRNGNGLNIPEMSGQRKGKKKRVVREGERKEREKEKERYSGRNRSDSSEIMIMDRRGIIDQNLALLPKEVAGK